MSTETITHEKTPDTHSSIVGGSSAARILGCPGSVDLLAKIPDVVKNASSDYADEGTGLHEIMAYLVDNDIDINTLMTDETVDRLWEEYKLHDDRMWDAVIPAYRSFLAYLDTLYGDDPAAELLIRVESRVEMPGIDDAWGTCDILIKAPKKTVVWDWKFGQGVPVKASYTVNYVNGSGEPDPYEAGNDQLMFYARAAQHSYPDYFSDDHTATRPVELVICQPRILDEELSTFETDTVSLELFREDLVDAVEEALSGKGAKAKGSYCRFAACKSICPLHLNGAEAAARIGEGLSKLKTPREMVASVESTVFAGSPGAATARAGADIEYAEALSMMLELGEVLEPYIDEARKQAHVFMENGGQVPGHKLVPKKAGWDSFPEEQREDVDGFLSRRKLSVEERRKPWSPVTPAAARKLLKAKGDEKGLKLLEKYVKPGVSSGTTIARNDDPRPEVKATAAMIGELASKIASIGG